jgi:hypothetical protein
MTADKPSALIAHKLALTVYIAKLLHYEGIPSLFQTTNVSR